MVKREIIVKEYINLYFICFIICISFCTNNYKSFILNAEIKSQLEIMNIKDINNGFCEKLVPSLFFPTILFPSSILIETEVDIDNSDVFIPVLSNYAFRIGFYILSSDLILGYNNVIVGRERFSGIINNCYVGLSHGNANFTFLEERFILLNQLYKSNQIEKKIFSFGRWEIYLNSIYSNFYIGDVHELFLSKEEKGIIASCKNTNKNSSSFWGCYFNQINFNNTIVSLKMNNNELYPIYFASETYDIFIPISFKDNFKLLTNNKCLFSESDNEFYTYCENFFNEDLYQIIQLINDDMKITIEIDSAKRFTTVNNELKNKTRIRFHNFDYFIFPLIMFKNFHVQFDAENNIIQFYTTNKSILSVKNEEKTKKKGFSKVLLAFIIIIIIFSISVVGFIIYKFIRMKKEEYIQKDIKKIEDIEEFQSMN